MGKKIIERKYKLTMEFMIALLRGRELRFVDEDLELTFYPPQEGHFFTEEELREWEYKIAHSYVGVMEAQRESLVKDVAKILRLNDLKEIQKEIAEFVIKEGLGSS